MTPPTIEQTIAKLGLETTARAVSTSLTEYQKWLVGGVGAAIGLLLPKLHDLAVFIGDTRTVVVLALWCTSILMSVVSLLLGAQVLATTSVAPEMEKAWKPPAENSQAEASMEVMFNEMRRGLWWPALWGFDYGRRAMERGDHVAPGRLVARLSQIQAYLVIGQVLLILVSILVAATAALTAVSSRTSAWNVKHSTPSSLHPVFSDSNPAGVPNS